jgi:hypothetical protein
MTHKTKRKLEKLAKKYLWIETLKVRGRDSLDFHEVGVADLTEALDAAYELGKTDSKEDKADNT